MQKEKEGSDESFFHTRFDPISGKKLAKMLKLDIRTTRKFVELLGLKPFDGIKGHWFVSSKLLEERLGRWNEGNQAS